ncbi:Adenylate and Guanylate cyclase catalytic domain containing protein [Tritrichomonas foetus]|uniref:Adenylate and Guanylate cyclase catalytic domain containing protein n=1 Tax=Tritrichomonas foetus TaxID=1144522 RepID=A0A1J4KSU8_9EUKA|nr:Adenylate and Guanylate cyclase catalytic domain containing protein [Tritrichomonas foetus]|eukprot:OHT12734.1 Adenylate and Guanylate cyclase catalytic domain containing protein [Tritrichomonas foetus]
MQNKREMSLSLKSVSEQENQTKKSLVQGTLGKMDVIFPLFDESFKAKDLPKLLTEFVVDFCALQFAATGLWPSIPSNISFDGGIGKFFYYFFSILNLCDILENDTINFIFFAAEIFFVFCMYSIVLFLIHYYKRNRRFPKWGITLSKLFLEVINIVVLLPAIRYNGSSLLRLVKRPTTINTLEFIISFICMILIIILFYFYSQFVSLTPYISMASTVSWNGKITYSFILVTSFSQYFPYFFQLFSGYITSVWIILIMIFNAYIVYTAAFLPFVHIQTNALLGSLYFTMVILDIMSFIQFTFSVNIPGLAYIIVMFGFLIVALFSLHFVYSFIIKRTAKKLNVDFENNPEKDEYFMQLGLHKSESKCELFLRTGLTNHCKLFLDWSLTKFVVAHHPKLVFSCLRFCSYFPSEMYMIKSLFVRATKMPKIDISERFLIYQVAKINTLRASSSTSEITEKLTELDSVSRQMMNEVAGFWRAVPKDPSCLYEIKKKVDLLKARFAESIENWPNNVKIHEYFYMFLIESATEFKHSLVIKNRMDLIERGKNLIHDTSFNTLIRAYPFYIKKNIVDIKGNLLVNSRSRLNRSNSTSGSETISSGTIDGNLELEIEESLAKTSFGYPKLRLAFEASLAGRKSKYQHNQNLAAIWAIIVLITVLIFTFLYFQNIFNDYISNISRLSYMNTHRLGYDHMVYLFVLDWFNSTGLFPKDMVADMKLQNYAKDYNSDRKSDIETEENYWIDYAKDGINSYLNEIILLASRNSKSVDFLQTLFNDNTPSYYCKHGRKINMEKMNMLQSLVTFNIMNGKFLLCEKTKNFEWNVSDNMCDLIINARSMDLSYDNTAMLMTNHLRDLGDDIKKTTLYIEIIVAIGSLLLSAPILCFFNMRFFQRLKFLLGVMRGIDSSSQEEATKPLCLTPINEQQEFIVEAISSRSLNQCNFVIAIFIPCCIAEALFIGTIAYVNSNNDSFIDLNEWLYYGGSRSLYAIEVATYLTFLIGYQNGLQTQMIDRHKLLDDVVHFIDDLSTKNSVLLNGDASLGINSITGKDEEFDRINLYDICNSNETINASNSLYDAYKCLSLNRLILYYVETAKSIVDNIKNEKFAVNSNYFMIYNISVFNIHHNAVESANLIKQMADHQQKSFRSNLAAICFGGVAYLILALLYFLAELSKLNVAYEGALLLLRRLPPPAVINNNELFDYLIGKEQESNKGKLTASMRVFHLSKDAVICLNKNEIIEAVNKATTTLFGHKPEQLLGQPISFLLNDKNIQQRFALMRDGECSMLYECSSEALNDDDVNISVHVNLIGITDTNVAKSFVVILRDETDLIRRRKAAEEAKASSEKLLYQILPRDIVTRLNSGETDISFVVPKATIIFVDIVKFSDYSKPLTPSQIMINLSTIFAQFDNICSKYLTMTKIKLIGDVYMAAAGLFDKEDQVQKAAIEVVNFGLDVLSALEEINGILESSLTVRIGVNTDGPIIAGVLGTDKPMFDIIGDPINVAARLQSNGIPGTVQISSTTHEMIAGNHFNIEERGLIELKGKGKKMAYIVRPNPTGSFFIRDQQNTRSGFISLDNLFA